MTEQEYEQQVDRLSKGLEEARKETQRWKLKYFEADVKLLALAQHHNQTHGLCAARLPDIYAKGIHAEAKRAEPTPQQTEFFPNVNHTEATAREDRSPRGEDEPTQPNIPYGYDLLYDPPDD